jgi:EAL domain-containing protein (putative c-di-GMP-specific phosphodiesterase class I)
MNEIPGNDDNVAIVNALIAMSKQLNIKTLAEGVETQQQLDFLINQGCDQIQGYVFSEALPTEQFEEIVRENKTLYGKAN